MALVNSKARQADEVVSAAVPKTGPQRVAVVICAYNDRSTISATVRACRAIPAVDLIVVVDDGSEDDTAQVARAGGAVVVRHSVHRGRTSALETGVKVIAMRDRADWPARHLLFLDPDLGDSAIESSVLVAAVMDGIADCAIATPAVHEKSAANRGARRVAAGLVKNKTGWTPSDPLSTQRCLTREALNAVMPFSTGVGVDVLMTIDLLVKGFSVVELPCAFERLEVPGVSRRERRTSMRSELWFALQSRRPTIRKLARDKRPDGPDRGVGHPYSPRR